MAWRWCSIIFLTGICHGTQLTNPRHKSQLRREINYTILQSKTRSLLTCIWKAFTSSLPRLSGLGYRVAELGSLSWGQKWSWKWSCPHKTSATLLGTKANCWLVLNESAGSSLAGPEPVVDKTLDLQKFVSDSNFSHKWKDFAVYCRVSQSIKKYYRVLQSVTEYYRVIQSIT